MNLFPKLLCICLLALTAKLTGDEQSADKLPYNFVGTHFMASYKECDHDALVNLPKLKEALIAASKASGATILKTADYTFEPDGLTMVVLLSESHASIHTYPEFNAVFVDLFTCGHNCSAKAFDEVLRGYLAPKKVSKGVFERD